MVNKVIDNPVENYLKENSGKNLSLRRIYRDLRMKRRKTIWLIHKSDKIKTVNLIHQAVGIDRNIIHW